MDPNQPVNINSWLEDELYQQYRHDHSAVDDTWKHVFETTNGAPTNGEKSNGVARPAPPSAPTAPEIALDGDYQPLRGVAGRIAENMAVSLTVPLATSQRTVAVKVMDENRRIINQHRTLLGKSKVSYTHLIGWAVVKALEEIPGLNHAYAEKDGHPFRVARAQVNLGVAVDVAGKDGSRALMVPNIKNAGALNFYEYVAKFGVVGVVGGLAGADHLNGVAAGRGRRGGGDGQGSGPVAVTLPLTIVSAPDFTISPISGVLVLSPLGSQSCAILVNGVGGFASNVNLAVTGLPSGISASFSPATVTPGTQAMLVVSAPAGALPSSTLLTITGTSGTLKHSSTVLLSVQNAVPAGILNPPPGATLTQSTTTFSWSAGSGASQYALWAGSSPRGQNYFAASIAASSLRITVVLPQATGPYYVTLASLLPSGWAYQDYLYQINPGASTPPLTPSGPARAPVVSNTSTTEQVTDPLRPSIYLHIFHRRCHADPKCDGE